jgi:hypothetical protein
MVSTISSLAWHLKRHRRWGQLCDMPELLSVHGRCPRCSQLLTVAAGQLESVFRCARCQYRVPGAALVEEARRSPPKLGHGNRSVLRPFDEGSDDQHTHLLLPGSSQEETEVALAAELVDGTPSIPPAPPPLQRFDQVADDADDQQTRVHVGGVFEGSGLRSPSRVSSVPASRRPGGRDATILGMPSAPQLPQLPPAPQRTPLPPLERAREDIDEATRVHLGGELRSRVGALDEVKDQTMIGVAPAPAIPGRPMPARPMLSHHVPSRAMPVLQRFDQVTEDAEDQNTRLQVPISYEDEGERELADGNAFQSRPAFGAGAVPVHLLEPLPELRPKVAPPPPVFDEEDLYPPRGLERFGRATLQVSRWIDDWLHDQRGPLLVILASVCGLIAPTLDSVLGSSRQAATVIAANLALFFLWTLLLGWFGTTRDDRGAWDYRVALTRIFTGVELALEDLRQFGRLPKPLRWRLCAEFSGIFGLFGLGLASALSLSQLVWGWPSGNGFTHWLRTFSALSIVLSVMARRTAGNVPLGFSEPTEVSAPAVAHFPAVVDLSLPLSVNPAHSSTIVHQVLDVLSQWSPREWPNRDSYIAALERHLMRQMGWARIEKDRWLGEERTEGVAPLLVSEGLLIEVIRGFDPDSAGRVSARMKSLAKVWRGKPAILVIFDASRAALLDSAGTPPLEALHQSYPMLAVRMPSARLSMA